MTDIVGRTSLSIQGRAAFSSSRVEISGRTSLQLSARIDKLQGLIQASEVTLDDPLWIALEIDLISQDFIHQQTINTLRLSNRGSLQRTVDGVVYQYSPRLLTDIIIGTAISIATDYTTNESTPFYQQPLRGQPNGGTVSWAIDADSTKWLGQGGQAIIGRTFRLYTGNTFNDAYADVDNDLTLVYTGEVANFTYDVTATPSVATIQTTDSSSDLDKSLVDDLYPLDFPIVSLQGKPKNQLMGMKYSIAPVLEDQISLTYRVTRVEPGVIDFGDVIQLTVGGIPWRRVSNNFFRVDTTPTIVNKNALYAALAPGSQAIIDADLVAFPDAYNSGNGLQALVNRIALLTYYDMLSPADQLDFQMIVAANIGFYSDDPTGDLNKIGTLINNYYGIGQGQYTVDTAVGTVQLGSDPGGADVRVDAYTADASTLTLAGLITKICNIRGKAVNAISMAQLDIDCPTTNIGFYTGNADSNCLDILDRITSAMLCTWTFDNTGAVVAQIFDASDNTPDLFFVGFPPDTLEPFIGGVFTPRDPIPKMINTISQVGLIPPAYRARIGYAGRANPQSSFLDGTTVQEQVDFASPELIADWVHVNGFALSPSDGVMIKTVNPRAQDVYISSILNGLLDAQNLRARLIQRVIGFVDHQLWSLTVRMDPRQVKMMSSIQISWVDENNRYRISYTGNFRVTSAIMVLGGGPQQLELWGSGTVTSSLKSALTPSMQVPNFTLSINFLSFQVLSDSLTGYVIANIMVTVSDGSIFTGIFSFVPPDLNASGIVTTDGNFVNGYNLILARNLSMSDIGSHTITISAIQNEVSVSTSYTFVVLPLPVINWTSGNIEIFDNTPLGTVVNTFTVSMSDGSPFTGTVAFGPPNFDDGGVFAITGPISGPGPYSLVLNSMGSGLPASSSTEIVTVVATQL